MSTPPGHREPHDGTPLEPVRVIRPRRTDALAELIKEFKEFQETQRETGWEEQPDTGGYESVRLPPQADRAEHHREDRAKPRTEAWAEDRTEELPPVATGNPERRRRAPGAGHGGSGRGLRGAAVALGVGAAALVGFGCALLLPGKGDASAAEAPRPTASASSAAPTPAPTGGTASADPDGAGTLRQGDSGPEVIELQQRLRRIPDVYRDGATNGQYDTALKEAVARFQLWYGIRGDETGVYGNDTRSALESRTSLDDG